MTRIACLCALLLASLLLVGCDTNSDDNPTYEATIAEGRAIVREEMENLGAASVSVALVDSERVIWSEAFGKADRDAGVDATAETLYSLCSISKIFATVAVMVLVERGDVALDEPLVTYVPGFSMPLDERYRDITVRMLLNHSSGIPGYETGEASSVPIPEYAALLLDGIKHQRLLHEPGALSGYNNDGFTMTQNLIKSVTGKDYPEFIREEILVPLEMNRSQFQDQPLPEGSYARSYDGDTLTPLPTLNVYATGGLFSTAEDMAHLAMMLLNGGVYGSRRILSGASITAMAQDERKNTFNPVPNENFRFGLGWDTIAQPGLEGVIGWQKGGDVSGYYGTNILVAPDENLAVVVMGATGSLASQFTSSTATDLSTRILLRALVERGKLPRMPDPLTSDSLPLGTVTQEEKDAYSGFYASSNGILRVMFEADDSLTVDLFDSQWGPLYKDYKLRNDGWYAADSDPVKAVQFLTRSGNTYLAMRMAGASPHYSTSLIVAQRLEEAPNTVSDVWMARLEETWLPVNEELYLAFPIANTDPAVWIYAIPGLDGYLAGGKILREMNPPSEDRLDGLFLYAPDGMRGLYDAVIETRGGQEWLWLGSSLLRPKSGVPLLDEGQTTLTVEAARSGEWLRLPAVGSLTINNATHWILYDENVSQIDSGASSGSITLAGSEEKYLVLYADTKTEIELVLQGQ